MVQDRKPKTTHEEKRLIHREELELEKKLKQKVKDYTSEAFSRSRLSEMKRTQRMKTSVRPQRRKG